MGPMGNLKEHVTRSPGHRCTKGMKMIFWLVGGAIAQLSTHTRREYGPTHL